MYLFFDTETTGLPRNWRAPVSDVDNWPRMIQIAWQEYDENGNNLTKSEYIIRPEGFSIPADAAAVHGISTERALEEGHYLEEVLNDFVNALNQTQTLVAHNMSFDEKIVGAELIRSGVDSRLFELPKICTKDASTDFCALPGPYGYKWPKLSELHIKLFGKDFEEAHDAAVDVEACARCFFELKNWVKNFQKKVGL